MYALHTISFPGFRGSCRSDTRMVPSHYVDFDVKHHVNRFRFQSLSLLSMIALTTLQIRRLLWDDVESANVCIVRCSIYSCAPGVNNSLYIQRLPFPWQVIRLVRPFRCDNTLGFCCLQELEVQCPPGKTIGWIKQNCSLFSPLFSVTDANGQVVYKIKGPCFSCKWCDVEFQVYIIMANLISIIYPHTLC